MDFKDYIPSFKSVEKKNYKHRFTVFTPVYNAQYTIERTHDSLVNQTFKDFEWLIINDGSSDDSHAVIEKIIKTSPLNINYVNNTVNKHKMACFMQAIDLAEGEFFLTFDADDECYENSLETFDAEYNSIPEERKKDIIAVTVHCIDQNGRKIGSEFPDDPYYSTPFVLHAVDNVKGEKWGFTKTDALRGLDYTDDFVSNGFMSLGMVWNILAENAGETKFVNTILRVYHVGVENSISSSSKEKRALGLATSFIAKFNMYFNKYFFSAPVFFLKNLYLLLSISVLMDVKMKDFLKAIDSYLVKFFFILLWPFRRLMKFPY